MLKLISFFYVLNTKSALHLPQKMKARKYKEEIYLHVYQRTINRFNIFYDIKDYLIYFSIFCVAAERYGIAVMELCLMIDHIHMLIKTSSKKNLSEFISFVTSVFVREYNSSIGRKGSLFESRFGSAPKLTKKKLMSAIIYIGNNPVERKICIKGENYRWNFIAYISSDHPFSKALVLNDISYKLKKAIKEINFLHKNKKHLNYGILERLFNGLTSEEKNQLTDYIIHKYNVLDIKSLMSHFDSYQELLISLHSTTGSEYDLKEDQDSASDLIYREMIKVTRKHYGEDIRKVISSSPEEKFQIAEVIRRMTSSQIWQIEKFLHLKVKKTD